MVATLPAFSGWSHKISHRSYKGNDALIAFIVKKKRNPFSNDYTVSIVDAITSEDHALDNTTPPTPPADKKGETAAEWVLQQGGSYVEAVLNAYDQEVKDTDGAKGAGTQLGNATHTADYR